MDPQLAAILEQLPLTPIARAEELAERRKLGAEFGPMMLEKQIGDLGGPEQFADVRVEDLTIPGPDGDDLALRIYTPGGVTGPLPVAVFLHGGGFMIGNLDTDHVRCLVLATGASCVVVSVDYRLAPENPYPAAVDDAYAALVWTVEQAPRLGVDVSRIAVAGESAGGCIAASVALLARDRGGPELVFQLLVYAVLDDRINTPSMATPNKIWDRGSCELMWEAYLPDGDDYPPPYAVPNRVGDLAGLPPAYVLAAGLDVFRDEDVQYALRLLEAGVDVELHVVPGVTHGFDILALSSEVGAAAFRAQANALRRAFQLPLVEA